MKTEWTFPWHSYDFHFKKVHRFIGTFGVPADGTDGPPEGMQTQIRIEPDPESPADRSVEQSGKLIITLPLPPGAAEEWAHVAAYNIGEQIACRNGDFRVHYGFVTCRRIAENDEEEAAIDGKPYSIRLHLTEVVSTPEFDGSRLSAIGGVGAPVDLLSQFNETRRDTNLVRKFLGYFRVLESLSHSEKDRRPLKQALRDFVLLRDHYRALLPAGDYDAFVETIVESGIGVRI